MGRRTPLHCRRDPGGVVLRSVACPMCKYPNAAGAPACVSCKTSLVAEPQNPANQTVRRTPPNTPRPGAVPSKATELARPLPPIAKVAGDDLGFDDEITDRLTPPATSKSENTQRVDRDAVLRQ